MPAHPGGEPVPTSPDGPVFTRERQAAFLAALAEGREVRRAAARAGVSHATAYRERRASPAFRQAWDAALLAARVHAEQVLATRAVDGVEEEVWYHGEVVATRRRYDSRLLLAHLGRLDRLCADARTQAFAEDFEAALARFERGEEAVPEAACAQDGLFAPGQCNKCNSPGDDDEGEDANVEAPGWDAAAEEGCPECGGRCLDPSARLTRAHCQWLGNRLDRMYAARPRTARTPHQFPGDSAEIESVQLAAFEAGVERWWLAIDMLEQADGGTTWVWEEEDPYR